MSKFLSRLYQFLVSVVFLSYIVWKFYPKTGNIIELLLFSVFLIFPFLMIISRSPENRLASTLVNLSTLLPYFLSKDETMIIFAPLFLASIDIDLRNFEVRQGRFFGVGFLTLFYTLLLQYSIYLFIPSTFNVLILTFSYFLLVIFYEAIRIARVEIDKPKELLCEVEDIIELKIKFEKLKGLQLKVLGHEKYKVVKDKDSIKVFLRKKIKTIGRQTLKMPFVLSGSRKFLIIKRSVKIVVDARPRLEKAMKEAYKLALQILPRYGESRDFYDIGSRARYGGRGVVYALRPYVPGDDIRSINYKKSVNKGEFVVNEYVQSGLLIKKGPRFLKIAEGYSSIVIYVDLSSNSIEELDSLAYNFLSLVIDLIEANLPPRAVFIIQGDRVLYKGFDMKTNVLLIQLLNTLSKITISKYREYSLDEPIFEFSTLPLMVEFEFIKQAVRDSDVYNEFEKFIEMLKSKSTIIIIRSAKRKPGLYGFMKNIMSRRDYNIVEFKL